MIKTVAARNVVVGDELYNSQAPHPAFRWVRVSGIRQNADGDCLILETFAWETWKHPDEAVSVRRGGGD